MELKEVIQDLEKLKRQYNSLKATIETQLKNDRVESAQSNLVNLKTLKDTIEQLERTELTSGQISPERSRKKRYQDVDYLTREFFCSCCGLFYWVDMRSFNSSCPNPSCWSHIEGIIPVRYATDTAEWKTYAGGNERRIFEVKWTTTKYSPKSAIEMYKMQAVPILDADKY